MCSSEKNRRRKTELRLSFPMTPPLMDLTPAQLDVLQQVHNSRMLNKILDQNPATDLSTYDSLLHLMKSGFVEIVPESSKQR